MATIAPRKPESRETSAPAAPAYARPVPATASPRVPVFPSVDGRADSALNIPLQDLLHAPAADPFAKDVRRSVGDVMTMTPSFGGMPAMEHHPLHTRTAIRTVSAPMQSVHTAKIATPTLKTLSSKTGQSDAFERAMKLGSKPKSPVKLERPAVVPSGPYTLTPYVMPLKCGLKDLRTVLQTGFTKQNVDYEYNDAKWKAKCYVYRSQGNCHFVARLYSKAVESSEDFILELQRRRGCCHVFRLIYDSILLGLAKDGLLDMHSDVGKRAGKILERSDQEPLYKSTHGGAEYPASLVVDVDPDLESNPSSQCDDNHAIVEAFANMGMMLASPFDDITAPAAQSIASLTSSMRICSVLGQATVTTGIAAARGSPSASSLPPPPAASATRMTSTCSVSSSATAASQVEKDDAALVLRLFRSLLERSITDTYSIDCRTASAIALFNLSRDKKCADAINSFWAPPVLVSAAVRVPLSAQTAALRRTLVALVERLLPTWSLPATFTPELKAQTLACVRALTHESRIGFERSYDEVAPRVAKAFEAALNKST